jgi:uncharacterized membrane protein YfcA
LEHNSTSLPLDLAGKRVPLLFAGLLTGFISAFFGIGGGIVLVPLLTLVFRMAPLVAAGTSLGVIIFIAGTGLTGDLINGELAYRPALMAAMLIAPFSVLAARKVVKIAPKVPTVLLRRAFALLLLIGAAKNFGWIGASGDGTGLLLYRDPSLAVFFVLPLLGILVGGMAALLGVGGGVLLVPGLDLLFRDLLLTQCRATSLLIVVPVAFFGYQRHLEQGTAHWKTVRSLVPPCILGAVLGVLVVHHVSVSGFRVGFGILLAIVGVKLFLAGRR